MYTKFNVGAARQVCLGAEVRSRANHELELKEKLRDKYDARGRLLEEKDLEILKLKSKLAEKEAEAVEVIRLHDQVSSLSEEKSSLTVEVSALRITVTQKDHDISLLNSRATSFASTLDDAKVTYAEVGYKITSLASERDRLASEDFKEMMEVQQAQELYNRVAELEAHIMDVSGCLEGEFYPTYLTTLAGRRWLLPYRIQLALLKCLKSPEYQGTLGHALGRAVDFCMQEGLETGHEHGTAGRSLSAVDAYKPEAARARYVEAVKALEDVDFPLVSLLKSKKDDGMDEVLDCFLLYGPLAVLPEAAYLQPCIEQLSVLIHHAGFCIPCLFELTSEVGATALVGSLSFMVLDGGESARSLGVTVCRSTYVGVCQLGGWFLGVMNIRCVDCATVVCEVDVGWSEGVGELA
ncbi:hypothetical protein Tco_1006948 [Tanacetum coccineum]|uniref:FRIGIDA-like protein n=1 Tax=Tanacetum coccineum TaxID=301880 RepID=A0ABQ5FJE0_9ASTR